MYKGGKWRRGGGVGSQVCRGVQVCRVVSVVVVSCAVVVVVDAVLEVVVSVVDLRGPVRPLLAVLPDKRVFPSDPFGVGRASEPSPTHLFRIGGSPLGASPEDGVLYCVGFVSCRDCGGQFYLLGGDLCGPGG